MYFKGQPQTNMKKILLVSLLPLLWMRSYSQETDKEQKELVLNLNVFNSDEEKKLFANILNGKAVDYFQLMLLTDSDKSKASIDAYSNKVESFIQSKGWLEKKDLNSPKSIKKIYKDIHDAFFTQYVENPSFGQIFLNGNYNCATATALYAFLLDKLSIQYNIRETPQHVYIIAAPGTFDIVFETTAPGAMVYSYNDKMKNQYLEYLFNNKLISKEEWNNEDKNKLFEKYFYSDKLIKLHELAGLLYYNLGVTALQEQNYLKAYNNFEKSYFLYPQPKLKYFVSVCAGAMIYQSPMQDEEKYPYYIRYTQIGNAETSKTLMLEYRQKISKKYLFQNTDRAKYFSIYHSVLAASKDSSLLKDLKYEHYHDMARYFSIKNSHDSSKVYIDSLYAFNPNDLLIQELITETVFKIVYNYSETKLAVAELKKFFAEYPFIKSNSRLQEYYMHMLAREVGMKYEKENHKEGSPYLVQLKECIQQHPSLAAKSEIVIPAITEVSGYYVRKGDYKSAHALLDFINKLIPNNEEITRRLAHTAKMLKQK